MTVCPCECCNESRHCHKGRCLFRPEHTTIPFKVVDYRAPYGCLNGPLNLNALYGRYASDLRPAVKPETWSVLTTFFLAKRIRSVLRVT